MFDLQAFGRGGDSELRQSTLAYLRCAADMSGHFQAAGETSFRGCTLFCGRTL
jgi:hypothetical protein